MKKQNKKNTHFSWCQQKRLLNKRNVFHWISKKNCHKFLNVLQISLLRKLTQEVFHLPEYKYKKILKSVRAYKHA